MMGFYGSLMAATKQTDRHSLWSTVTGHRPIYVANGTFSEHYEPLFLNQSVILIALCYSALALDFNV